MKIELLKEPYLEFGNDFICDDPKMGINAGGFFSQSNNTHHSDLHFSVIGTNKNIEDLLKWVKHFEGFIEATEKETKDMSNSKIINGEIISETEEDEIVDSVPIPLLAEMFDDIESEKEDSLYTKPEFEINKRLNPDFPGFNDDTPFHCKFINDDANNIPIREKSIRSILDNSELSNFEKAVKVADLYINSYKFLIEKSISKPEVCFIVIPTKVFKKLSSIPFKGGKFFNLRRYLKAKLITLAKAIPVQIVLEDTILGIKKSLQDLSMQAWNYCVANYYKIGGTPWTLSLRDKHTCFIGISFHRVLDSENNLVRSSVAQAFNYEGKGIIFIGEQFEWDSENTHTPAPHLAYEYAKKLLIDVIQEYKGYNKNLPPTRVVIHKTTDYWNSKINKDYAEVEGLKDGIREILGDEVEIDLVSIKSSDLKVLRKDGNYPVIRGTMLEIDAATALLYTTGYIPYYETFPGQHMPHPLEIGIYEAESTLKKICEEILGLTKMNFNNCNYYNSLPITIQFAQKVGEITQYMDEEDKPPNRYFYYM